MPKNAGEKLRSHDLNVMNICKYYLPNRRNAVSAKMLFYYF